MIKVLLAVLVAALATAVLLMPAPEAPAPGLNAAVDPPAVAVCPVEEGSGRSTTVAVSSSANGAGRMTVFAGGAPAGSSSFGTGASGSAAIPLADLAAVGTAAGLAELPAPVSAAATLLTGAESVAVESCLATPSQQSLLAGGSTVSGEQFQLQLMNPYAGEAMVDLIVVSESGLETAPQLRGIAVPSRSSQVIDLSEILPGRETLSISIEVVTGSVMAAGRLGVGGDVALWHSVPPALDWYVPVPAAGQGGELIISSGIGVEVEFQLDVYGPEGLVEAFEEGVVPERGMVTLPLAEYGFEAASAFRVISTQPVSVFHRMVSETGVALTAGSTVPAPRWMLPAAGLAPGSTGSAVILNPGLEQATVVVTAHREQSAAQEIPVPAGAVLEVPALEGGAIAHTVRGDGEVVPMWTTVTPTGTAYSSGVPIIDE